MNVTSQVSQILSTIDETQQEQFQPSWFRQHIVGAFITGVQLLTFGLVDLDGLGLVDRATTQIKKFNAQKRSLLKEHMFKAEDIADLIDTKHTIAVKEAFKKDFPNIALTYLSDGNSKVESNAMIRSLAKRNIAATHGAGEWKDGIAEDYLAVGSKGPEKQKLITMMTALTDFLTQEKYKPVRDIHSQDHKRLMDRINDIKVILEPRSN